MRHALSALALMGCLAATPPFAPNAHAQGALTVLGAGPARACYLAARDAAKSAEALRACDLALQASPLTSAERAATFVNRGVLHLQRRDAAPARADFDAALRLAPDLAEAHVNRGAALILLGEFAGALTALDRGLALGPADAHEAHFNRAIAYEQLGDLRRAYADYRQALALKPEWPLPAEELARFTVERR